MKSTYEQRWGHKRTRKATKHLEIKAQKRAEAEQRNERWNKLTVFEKMTDLHSRIGNSEKQRSKLRKL